MVCIQVRQTMFYHVVCGLGWNVFYLSSVVVLRFDGKAFFDIC
jgi:hypothetical protein